MVARFPRARFVCLLLVVATVPLAVVDVPPSVRAQTERATDTTPDLEDRQGWSADRKALEATKRATELKAQANRRKGEPCPAAADWDVWFQETLDLEASWVAMRDVRDMVRRSGAGSDMVKPFTEAFGSFREWEALVGTLRQSMIDCARQLNVKRGDSSDEYRMVARREQERRAIELGDLGFGPRVPGARGITPPSGSMAPSTDRPAAIATRISAGRPS